MGLRYDLFPNFTSQHGYFSMFDPQGKRFIVPTQAAINAIPSSVTGILPFPLVSASAAGLPQTGCARMKTTLDHGSVLLID